MEESSSATRLVKLYLTGDYFALGRFKRPQLFSHVLNSWFGVVRLPDMAAAMDEVRDENAWWGIFNGARAQGEDRDLMVLAGTQA
ncbi:hypothetical protein RRG08_050274 [Elysia crispata]|uniref:Uncharacterized protein n=1 Tax=Elysia crispata TaxID=231223 RepID=A0AAE1B479_9GAST|nr:hypothetical protein RRG08_050274 [Elysia crispata]